MSNPVSCVNAIDDSNVQDDREEASCESTLYQTEKVCVPVTVTPYAKPGTAKAVCCGEPVVSSGTMCQGTDTSCTFTVTQSLCIEIPISFGADIRTGKAVVECGESSETPCQCLDETE